MRINPSASQRGFVLGVLASALASAVVACGQSVSQADQHNQQITSQQGAIYDRGQPVHLYDYSQDRASFQAVYDARVQGKATYSVSVPQMGGQPWFACPSRGYPIPATSQLTNPEYSAYANGTSTTVTLPQPEPNGLYSGNTDGTYMQCVDTDGSLYSVYSEPPVLTFPFAVTWDSQKGFVKANPNDKASYTLPTAPAGSQAATGAQPPALNAPTPTVGRP